MAPSGGRTPPKMPKNQARKTSDRRSHRLRRCQALPSRQPALVAWPPAPFRSARRIALSDRVVASRRRPRRTERWPAPAAAPPPKRAKGSDRWDGRAPVPGPSVGQVGWWLGSVRTHVGTARRIDRRASPRGSWRSFTVHRFTSRTTRRSLCLRAAARSGCPTRASKAWEPTRTVDERRGGPGERASRPQSINLRFGRGCRSSADRRFEL